MLKTLINDVHIDKLHINEKFPLQVVFSTNCF